MIEICESGFWFGPQLWQGALHASPPAPVGFPGSVRPLCLVQEETPVHGRSVAELSGPDSAHSGFLVGDSCTWQC